MNVRTSYERKRGCGFRKGGGLYLVSGSPGEPCSALPVPLSVCPTCHSGVKPTRGWTWIDPKALLGLPRGPHPPEHHNSICPLTQLDGLGLGERAGLLWVGEAFYKTPEDFTREACELGVSRRIAAVPKGWKVGDWVLLAHRLAVVNFRNPRLPDIDPGTPGVFHLFVPRAIEYVVKGTETDAELEAIEKRGIELVRVLPAIDAADVVPLA